MSKIYVTETTFVETTQVIVFQIDGTQLTPEDPVVSTPWATQVEALEAAKTYADQLNAWWQNMYPGDIYLTYDDIVWDLIHLDENNNTIRFGIVPDPNDNPPLPVDLTGCYIGAWINGTDWMPLPM